MSEERYNERMAELNESRERAEKIYADNPEAWELHLGYAKYDLHALRIEYEELHDPDVDAVRTVPAGWQVRTEAWALETPYLREGNCGYPEAVIVIARQTKIGGEHDGEVHCTERTIALYPGNAPWANDPDHALYDSAIPAGLREMVESWDLFVS